MRILALGDVVGRLGRHAIRDLLPNLKKKYELDFVIANGENSAGGVGITTSTLNELLSFGVDCVTGGNHSWKNKEIFNKYETETRVLRPGNFPDPAPGRGSYIYTKNNFKIAVLNIQGTTFMDCLPCPFIHAHNWLDSLDDDIIFKVVDFHAEATSEKKCLSFYLDGKVSAVFGTHTHVQTADAQILPKGTAYITDLGMCGVEQSCLGMSIESVLPRFITKRPSSFKRADGTASLNGLIFELDEISGMAKSVTTLRENCPRTSLGISS